MKVITILHCHNEINLVLIYLTNQKGKTIMENKMQIEFKYDIDPHWELIKYLAAGDLDEFNSKYHTELLYNIISTKPIHHELVTGDPHTFKPGITLGYEPPKSRYCHMLKTDSLYPDHIVMLEADQLIWIDTESNIIKSSIEDNPEESNWVVMACRLLNEMIKVAKETHPSVGVESSDITNIITTKEAGV